ncbi:MAG: rRNA methyltransferase [Desulfobacteraceae bacterium]|nr:MAG: rRNA methyltransferase [Desulfobacteraceae bacterium]
MMNPVERVLKKITLTQTRHPAWVFSLAIGLAAVSIIYTVRNLEFQTGHMDVISPKERFRQTTEQLRAFSELDAFIVVVENRGESRSLEFLRALVPRLQADHSHYRQIFYRVDPERFKPWALLYMGIDELSILHETMEEHRSFLHALSQSPDLVQLFKAINHEMTSAMVGGLFTGFLDEPAAGQRKQPTDLSFLISTLEEMKEWLEGDTSFESPWESFLTRLPGRGLSEEGYFWTEERKYLLIFVTPTRKEGFTEALHSLNALRDEIAEIKGEFPDIDVGVTGMGALNQDEMGVAFNDMSIATLISLLGLALLLVLFWRGWRLPVLEMIELSVALCCTFGLTTLLIGHLNILSITFAPLLLGLGIDYGIHWLARFQEEARRKGVSREQAVQIVMLKLGPGILLAGATAALSFFPLVLTGFKGLVELGLITSMGMILSTMTTLSLLPVLTLLFGGPVKRKDPILSRPTTPLNFGRGRSLAIIICGISALALSLWAGRSVSFDLNMLNLQAEGAESVVWEKKLIEGSRMSSMAAAVLVNSLEEVRPRMEALARLPTVSEAQSILSFLPEEQEAKIQRLREMSPLLDTIGPFSNPSQKVDLAALNEVLGQLRFKLSEHGMSSRHLSRAFQDQMARSGELIDFLRQRFSTISSPSLLERLEGFENRLIDDLVDKLDLVQRNLRAAPMRISDLPESLVQRFVGEDGRYLIRVFPSVDIWDTDLLGRFVGEVKSMEPDAAGDPVGWYFFTRAFRDACIKAAFYAVLFILIVLVVTFRSVRAALPVTIPLVAGTVWTLGLMGLLDIDFNLANTVFLPLVVGAGVEYGIIIMRRHLEEKDNPESVAIPWSTVKGVLLAGLTTAVGFGSLTISSHQGIHSLGLLAAVGSLSILAAAVLFLPAVLQVLRKR